MTEPELIECGGCGKVYSFGGASCQICKKDFCEGCVEEQIEQHPDKMYVPCLEQWCRGILEL